MFIDSCLWGCANQLLKIIDKEYCIHSNGKFYDYDKRNYSTSHVHMMLSIALNTMIDNCEAIIFLNTPNSIKLSEEIKVSRIMSPWIYNELATTKFLRRKKCDRCSSGVLEHGEYKSFSESKQPQLEILYDVKEFIECFIDISKVDIEGMELGKKVERLDKWIRSPLDSLYENYIEDVENSML